MGQEMWLHLGNPTMWVVLRSSYDGSAIHAVFGPFSREIDAGAVADALNQLDVPDNITVQPLTAVMASDRVPGLAKPAALSELQRDQAERG